MGAFGENERVSLAVTSADMNRAFRQNGAPSPVAPSRRVADFGRSECFFDVERRSLCDYDPSELLALDTT
jgi:hypothetical protein